MLLSLCSTPCASNKYLSNLNLNHTHTHIHTYTHIHTHTYTHINTHTHTQECDGLAVVSWLRPELLQLLNDAIKHPVKCMFSVTPDCHMLVVMFYNSGGRGLGFIAWARGVNLTKNPKS